jgi:hypothetical protein
MTIVFCFFSAPVASSSSDEEATSSLLSDSLLSRQEVAYPILLADVADEGPGDRSTRSTNVIPAGDYSGTNVIPAGGKCRSGRACKNGTCRALDVCVSGYVCSNGKCSSRRSRSISNGGVCQLGDVCADGTACIGNRCVVPLVPPGGVCGFEDFCESGYVCSNGRCASSRSRSISNGGVCRVGDVCDSGYTCIGGMCTLPYIPAREICRSGIDTCVNEYICMNSICIAPAWFATDSQNDSQNCVMDCLSTDSPCCGGIAQSWQHSYSTVEECCGQSMFQGNYDGCLSNSIQCRSDEHDNKLPSQESKD